MGPPLVSVRPEEVRVGGRPDHHGPSEGRTIVSGLPLNALGRPFGRVEAEGDADPPLLYRVPTDTVPPQTRSGGPGSRPVHRDSLFG